MTRKFWNWVRNEEPDSFGSDRTLYLDGEISDETWFGDEVTPKLFRDELHAGDGNITLWINSPGGDVFAAAQIYNMLMDYPHDVTVKIDALAASAASVIAMAGTKVCMSPVAMMMVHNPATIAIGDTEEMQKAIDMLNEVKESIMNAYEIKSGLSRHKISQLMDAETWMNAKEAVKLGFADEILFRDGEKSVPEDTADTEMLFSRKAVTDSLLLQPIRRPSGTTSVIPAILQSAMYLRKEPMQTADTLFRLNSSTPLFRRSMKTTSCVLSAARSSPHRTSAMAESGQRPLPAHSGQGTGTSV